MAGTSAGDWLEALYSEEIFRGHYLQKNRFSIVTVSSQWVTEVLDLPTWSSYRPLNNYETDAVAWNFTCGTHRIPLNGPFPTQDLGRKLWAFLRLQDSKKLSSIDFYMDEDGFSLSGKPNITKYDFEAVVLQPGDELHMLPNSAHWVYGIDDVIAQGGHYYSSYLMQETLQGVVHAFVLNKFLTNTEHIPSHHLLRRILIFYQVGLIEGGISEDDPALVHLPNVETMEDFRTYSTPNQGENDEASPTQKTLMDTGDINAIPNNERIAYSYACGVALHILKWLRSSGSILTSLSDYKRLAEAKSYGRAPHCTSHLLSKQIANILEVDPILKAAWAYKERVPSHSLALEEKEKYNVEWRHDWEHTSWRAPSVDFALAGQTLFDTKFFQATKLRINSENANMIVDMVKPLCKKAKVE
ncbi:uncharacterized protein LACBIDRAFT_332749 [Laccaria bicolor S238N-H82]|uniref:Predicted protein n=1 Tax=Laccaria bicolor (strain S238N-H82 / ATCC MYA-4686) TaxID=486041 RepID=B0DTY9_LACBS|nr:uncharacterized protein LACBIDRAFT_332749 [Laccaria bicolor S238N-H82]EDR01932.1 predicted protein [Laccaria bicolor S238N-H82]|eukprot:XP_001887323.1 predicted protein [Laccaria bicolor S238N-H82]